MAGIRMLIARIMSGRRNKSKNQDMSKSKGPASAVITIFGARGDLTIRKLIPALYNLYLDGHLPDHFSIFCVDFVTIDQPAYRDQLLAGINEFSRRAIGSVRIP